MSDSPAKIIFLHGPSSSGKSTLARLVQATTDEPFWHISIDHLRDSGVLPSARFAKGDFEWRRERSKFFDGFHGSLVAYASAGNNLIVEHILDTPGWFAQFIELLEPFDVFFVGLHCSLEELESRERARMDRPMGSAAEDYRTVHAGLEYDLEIHSHRSPEENASLLIDAFKSRLGPSVFQRLISREPESAGTS